MTRKTFMIGALARFEGPWIGSCYSCRWKSESDTLLTVVAAVEAHMRDVHNSAMYRLEVLGSERLAEADAP